MSEFPAQRTFLRNRLFGIRSDAEFEALALQIFAYQFSHNEVYRKFSEALGRNPSTVRNLLEIPFMPVELFKNHSVVSGSQAAEMVFSSSGTTGMVTSQHIVSDLKLYEESLLAGFEIVYGKPSDWIILGLLPAYLERPGSSLVYMTEALIRESGQPENGFYLYNNDMLCDLLSKLKRQRRKTWLIGVSFALLDLAAFRPETWDELIVVETGGMKGRRKEMIREELHAEIRRNWPVVHLHSEYGMTELLSQAWMDDSGKFSCPPWMQVLIREADDPLRYAAEGKTGGINVVDLANLDSCSFLATADLGKKLGDGRFEVLGRFDHSDVRGCNLMIS